MKKIRLQQFEFMSERHHWITNEILNYFDTVVGIQCLTELRTTVPKLIWNCKIFSKICLKLSILNYWENIVEALPFEFHSVSL